jgi:hypothetical protein
MIREFWESYINRREDKLDIDLEKCDDHTSPRTLDRLQRDNDLLEQELMYFDAILPEGRSECSICSIS